MPALSRIRRYLQEQLLVELSRKAVVLTGSRQVGKTTLARQVTEGRDSPQNLNWDMAADRSVMLRQSGNPRADQLVFEEILKTADWKAWLNGVIDAQPVGQSLLF
jgi:predicted AAA+ superfamily ATPase